MARSSDLAHGRLLQLPDVFSVADMARLLDMERFDATRYLRAWRLRGLVVPLGGRSAVYMNRVRVADPVDYAAQWERALLKAMPSALVSCVELAAGHAREARAMLRRLVLVSDAHEYFEIDDAVVLKRPAAWIDRLRRSGLACVDRSGLPRLRPGAALADLSLHDGDAIAAEDADRRLQNADELQLFLQLISAEATRA